MSDRDEKETPTKRKSDIIRRFSLKRLRSVRKSRSNAGDDADSISVTSSTPEKTKSTPRHSLSNFTPSIESPLSKSQTLEVVSRAPTPAVDIPPEEFWDHAYDRLKSSQPELLDHYERILSVELRKIDIGLDHLDVPNVIAERSAQRDPQMYRLLEASLANIEKHSDAEGTMGTAVDIALSLRSAISSCHTAKPIPAVLWSGLCIALELSLGPAPSENDAIVILIQRMKWYSSVPQVLRLHKDAGSVDLRTQLAEQVLTFYQTVLDYTIRNLCARYLHSSLAIPTDSFSLDNWTGSLDEIDRTESSVRSSLCLFDARQETSNLGNTDGSQLSDKDREIMTACYAADASIEMKSPQQNGESLTDSRQDVLGTTEYINFVNRSSSNTKRVLSIKLNTARGGLIALVDVIQSLQSQLQTHFDEPCVCYFFCREMDSPIDPAAAPLKGLIWMLLRQAPTLIGYLRKEFEDAGHEIFDGPSSFSHLKAVFLNMIEDNALGRVYLIIDSLDACGSGLPHLLDLIVESSTNNKVKWILSSQSRADIDDGLSRLPAASLLLLDLDGSSEPETADSAAQLDSPDISAEIAPFTDPSSLPPLGAHSKESSRLQTHPDQNWGLLSMSNLFLLLGIILLAYEYRDVLLSLHVKLYDVLREFYDFN